MEEPVGEPRPAGMLHVAQGLYGTVLAKLRPQVTVTNVGIFTIIGSLALPEAMTYVLFYPFFRLVFGTLYPAYASYKAVRTKNVKEYVKWMMYWIVFALFTCAETFTDVFLSFWFPFYYEIKIILVLWLLSPATKGSSILYRKFVHPMLSRREQEIDEYIAKAKEQGYHTVLHLGSKGVNYATTVLMQTAIKGGGGLVNQLRKSYSLSDLSTDKDSDLNRNSKALKNVQDDDDLEEETDGAMDPRMLRSRGYSPRRSASGSGRVEMYFPEVDVDVRQRGTSRPRDPSIPLSHIRSTEDVSSGYSSAEPLYAGHPATKSEGLSASREPLVRTASVGSTRSMRTKSSRGGVVAKRGPAAEDNELVDAGDEAESSKQEEYFYDLPPSQPSHTSVSPLLSSTHNPTPSCIAGQNQSDIQKAKEETMCDSAVSAPEEELPLYDAETDVSEVLSAPSLDLDISSVPSFDETTLSLDITEMVVENEANKKSETNDKSSSELCLKEESCKILDDADKVTAPSLSNMVMDLETNLKSLENSYSKVQAAESKLSEFLQVTSVVIADDTEKETNKEVGQIINEHFLENNELLETESTAENSSVSEPAMITSPLTSLTESVSESAEKANEVNEQLNDGSIEKQCDNLQNQVEVKEATYTKSDEDTKDKENSNLVSQSNDFKSDDKITEIDNDIQRNQDSGSVQAVKAEFEIFTLTSNGVDNETKVEQETNGNGSTYGSVESLSPDEMPNKSSSQNNMQRAGRYNKTPAPTPPPRKCESEPEIWTDTIDMIDTIDHINFEPQKDDEQSSSISPSPSPTLTVKEMPVDKQTTENEDLVSPESSVTTARLVLKPGVVRSLGPDLQNKSEVFVSKPSQTKGKKYKSKQKHGESSFSRFFAFPKTGSLTSLIPFWHGSKQTTTSTQQQSSSRASGIPEQTGNTSVYIPLHEEMASHKRTSEHVSRNQELNNSDINDYSHMARTPVQSRKAPIAEVE